MTYTKDVAEVDRNRDWDVQAKGDVAISTRRVEHAMEALDAGKQEEAAKEIAAAQQVLTGSPAASKPQVNAAIVEQEHRLNSYQQTLKDGNEDVKKTKKFIQYDNYRTQRQK